jgi:hypothetical protein
MDMAPPMTLKRMYHWAPRDISKMPPMLKLITVAAKPAAAKGNRKLAGRLARI